MKRRTFLVIMLILALWLIVSLIVENLLFKDKRLQKKEPISSTPLNHASFKKDNWWSGKHLSFESFKQEETEIAKINTGKNTGKVVEQLSYSSGHMDWAVVELQKIDLLRNSTWTYNFWFRDCQKEFKSEKAITECQRLALKEAIVGCIDPEGPGQLSLGELFNHKKYSLLPTWEVERAYRLCEAQKRKFELQNNVSSDDEEITQRFNVFDFLPESSSEAVLTIWSGGQRVLINGPQACEKAINLAVDADPAYRKFWIERCEIGYVLNYWGWCKELKNSKLRKKCEEISKDIELYRKLQEAYYVYGSFVRGNPFYLPPQGQVLVKEKFDKKR